MPCEILFKFQDALNVDPALDRACYKTGDMVMIGPRNHPWGNAEKPPQFFVVQITDKVREELEDYFVSLEAYDDTVDPETGELQPNTTMLRRKRFRFDPALLPVAYRDQIYTTGKTVIRWGLFQTCMTQRID